MTDKYLHGHSAAVVDAHSVRTAEESAAFLLPHLEPGMSLLDVGCGPGTITVGLAERVAPGRVVGIDLSAEVIAKARGNAAAKCVSNVEFETADLYQPPFDDGAFDLAYMHQVLQHLSRPVDALTAALRVVKHGGTVAVREVDWGTAGVSPSDERLDRFFEVYKAVARRNGGEPFAGRHVPGWFASAGLADVTVTTSTWTFASPSGLRWWGEQWANRITKSDIATRAIEYGIATAGDLAEIAVAWREWIAKPGAFFCFTHVEALARKG